MPRVFEPSSSAWLLALALAAGALNAGCEDDLPDATLIQHMRVLGARTEVDGDPARSTPRPGERATLTWAVAYPELTGSDDELESLFIVCTEPALFTGTPVCEELIAAAQAGESPISAPLEETSYSCEGRQGRSVRLGGIAVSCLEGTPKLEVEVERSFTGRAKLVQGIICRGGTPELDLTSAVGVRCAAKSGVRERDVESIPVYGTVAVARDADDENENPSRDRIALRLRTENAGTAVPWPASPADRTLEELEAACEAGGVQRDRYRQFISIGYPPRSDDEDEILQFSAFTTYGQLSRRFTVLEPEDRLGDAGVDPEDDDEDDDIRPFEIAWSPTEAQRADLRRGPKLVRFYFSVLDGRGGFDLATRELCVGQLD